LVAGLGFMGGSLAGALTLAGWTVLVHHRRPDVAQRAQELGYGRRIDDLAGAMAQVQVAVVCTPVSTIAGLVRHLASLPGTAVLTDIGSVKGALCHELADLTRIGRFIGSHPMAGSHLQGLEHARTDLFHGCTTAIATIPGTPSAALDVVERLWQSLGSRTHRLDAGDHDRMVAEVSHAPHAVAAAVAAGAGLASLPLAASGFRDTTRVAAGDPRLWADILLTNRAAVAHCLGATAERLQELTALLERGDPDQVAAWLACGQEVRRRFDLERRPLTPGDGTDE
jgi:prephenate dehydrogenase